jgi:hypothetical protein
VSPELRSVGIVVKIARDRELGEASGERQEAESPMDADCVGRV